MDPFEIALRLKNEGSADPTTTELQKANAAANLLADSALKGQQEQERWNSTLRALDSAGLDKLENDLRQVVAETVQAGNAADILKRKLAEVAETRTSRATAAAPSQTGAEEIAMLGGLRGAARGLAADVAPAAASTNVLGAAIRQLAPAAAALKIAGLARDAVTYGESVKDAAERTGLAYDEVQKLTYAADQSATSFGDLEAGLKNLAVNLVENAKKLAEYKIAAKNSDGSARDLRTVLGDVAEVLRKTEDPAKRTAIAVDLLGRSGQQLVPLLSQGSVALNKFGADAVAAGRVLDNATIAKLDEAKQRLDNLQTSITINSGRLASWFMGFGEDLGGIAAALVGYGDGLDALGEQIPEVVVEMDSQAAAQERVNKKWEEGAKKADKYRAAATAAYAKNQSDEEAAMIQRANERIAAEEESKRTPEEKAQRAKDARNAQFDREVAIVNGSNNPETRDKGRAVLERERALDLAKIEADAQAERLKLDQEAAAKQQADDDAAVKRGLLGNADLLAKRAEPGVQAVGRDAKKSGNNELFDAAKKAQEAIDATRDGTTSEEAAAALSALQGLTAALNKSNQRSAALEKLVGTFAATLKSLEGQVNTNALNSQ